MTQCADQLVARLYISILHWLQSSMLPELRGLPDAFVCM